MSRWLGPRVASGKVLPENDSDSEAAGAAAPDVMESVRLVSAVACDAEPGGTAPRQYQQGGQSPDGLRQEMIGRRTLRKKMTFPRESDSGAQGGGEGTDKGVCNIYLVAMWVLLRGNLRDWKSVYIAYFGAFLGMVQTLVMLNIAWILNDEREVDVRDTIENYETHTAPQAYLLPHERDVQEVPLTPYHKHIVGQDDRFCPAAGVESFSSIWVYYRCIPGFDNSMTAWDILTIWLLVVPSFDKLVESHLELVYQVVLGVSGVQEEKMSTLRRILLIWFMALRCLQEALFVGTSVIIVSAAKGSLNMVLNSLAITFFADIDNIAWTKLLQMMPSFERIQDGAVESLRGEDSQVSAVVVEGQVKTLWFSGIVNTIYVTYIFVMKSPAGFSYFLDLSAPDTNIPVAMFTAPTVLILSMMALHCSAMATEVTNRKAASRDALESLAPVNANPSRMAFASFGFTLRATTLVCANVAILALNFMYYMIGLVELVIGAMCACRFTLLYGAVMSLAVITSQALLSARLTFCRRSSALSVALAIASGLLCLAAFGFAIWQAFMPNVASHTGSKDYNGTGVYDCRNQDGSLNFKCALEETLMGNDTRFRKDCLCGYSGWAPDFSSLNRTQEYCELEGDLVLEFERRRPAKNGAGPEPEDRRPPSQDGPSSTGGDQPPPGGSGGGPDRDGPSNPENRPAP